MQDGMGVLINVISAFVATAAAVFTLYQAIQARKTLKQASLIKLFSTFDLASQATLANPELLYSVHGLDSSVSPEEARNIAYLSLLLDGFQHFYGEKFEGKFAQMEEELKRESTFLNRVLGVEANQERFLIVKSLYYGEFDESFIAAIESLIRHEQSRKESAVL